MAAWWTLTLMYATVTTAAQAMSAAARLPPATPSPVTAAPPSSQIESGGCQAQGVGVLSPGQQKTIHYQGYCVLYQCSYQGTLQTVIGDCLPPMCADPVRNEEDCCLHCPNGTNCKLPSGEVIPANKEVNYNGGKCRCPDQSHEVPGHWKPEHHTAICTTPTANASSPQQTTTTFEPQQTAGAPKIKVAKQIAARVQKLTAKCAKMSGKKAEKCLLKAKKFEQRMTAQHAGMITIGAEKPVQKNKEKATAEAHGCSGSEATPDNNNNKTSKNRREKSSHNKKRKTTADAHLRSRNKTASKRVKSYTQRKKEKATSDALRGSESQVPLDGNNTSASSSEMKLGRTVSRTLTVILTILSKKCNKGVGLQAETCRVLLEHLKSKINQAEMGIQGEGPHDRPDDDANAASSEEQGISQSSARELSDRCAKYRGKKAKKCTERKEKEKQREKNRGREESRKKAETQASKQAGKKAEDTGKEKGEHAANTKAQATSDNAI